MCAFNQMAQPIDQPLTPGRAGAQARPSSKARPTSLSSGHDATAAGHDATSALRVEAGNLVREIYAGRAAAAVSSPTALDATVVPDAAGQVAGQIPPPGPIPFTPAAGHGAPLPAQLRRAAERLRRRVGEPPKKRRAVDLKRVSSSSSGDVVESWP